MILKYILTQHLGFLPQIIYRYALGSTLLETRGQGHSDLEPVDDSPGPKMYLHTKYGTATINNIGDLLWVPFFQDLTPEIKVTVAENSERHSMTPTYIHKLNLGDNMSHNMRHTINTMFCLLSVSCLVGELFFAYTRPLC